MKNSDEIKKGLEHCINGTSCRGCPYCEECATASDCNPMHKDLQEYVQQLEEFADKKIVELFEKVEQLQAERDALMDYLQSMGCDTCLHYNYDASDSPCKVCAATRDMWVFEGVQKEDSTC